MEDRALYLLYKRHWRLLGECMRALHSNQDFSAVHEELEVVHGALLDELVRRGHPRGNEDPETSYEDVESAFVRVFVGLDIRFTIKT